MPCFQADSTRVHHSLMHSPFFTSTPCRSELSSAYCTAAAAPAPASPSYLARSVPYKYKGIRWKQQQAPMSLRSTSSSEASLCRRAKVCPFPTLATLGGYHIMRLSFTFVLVAPVNRSKQLVYLYSFSQNKCSLSIQILSHRAFIHPISPP